MNEALRDLGDFLDAAIADNLLGVEIVFDQLNLIIRREAVVKVLTLLRDVTGDYDLSLVTFAALSLAGALLALFAKPPARPAA